MKKIRNRCLKALVAIGLVAASVGNTQADIIINFNNLTATGWQFYTFLGEGGTEHGTVAGELTGVSVNAVLNASLNFTYADDLTVYVTPTGDLALGGQLQAGGFSNMNAGEWQAWANGASDVVGTTVIDTITLNTPIVFNGNLSDGRIWIGNGYGASGTSGTWSGSITLHGVNSVSAVPEPTTLALSMIGLGVVGLVRRRKP